MTAVKVKGATRVAAVSFSNDKFPHFGFNDYTTKIDVLSAINYIEHSNGNATRTDLALKYTHEHIFAPDNGERSDVIDVVIVLTDGKSQRRKDTQSEAALIKDRGAYIFVIGVGREVNVDELNEISSDPDQKFTILVSSFSQLNSDEVKEMLLKRACFETMECQTGSNCPPGNGAQNIAVINKDITLANRLCQFHNDPHIRTFDGNNNDMMDVGEFVLYRNDNGPFGVYALFTNCGWTGASCNGGIAVRSRNSFFIRTCTVVSRTKQELLKTPITKLISCTENELLINYNQRRNEYTVKGLCGVPHVPSITKDQSDDYTDRENGIVKNSDEFAKSWRITPTMANEQMFVQEPGFINEELNFDPEMPS
ncbi:unnamed protein product [Mytilus edulis]|uniref:VWFA domain-containing protein n=1 Tax=Mytilus edulis TaxID=6550 RepID=A0A8S3V454_MYTED|nr:unnamed protein product [Mytilus edulis]